MSNNLNKLDTALEVFNKLIKDTNIKEATCTITWASVNVNVEFDELLPLPEIKLSFKKYNEGTTVF